MKKTLTILLVATVACLSFGQGRGQGGGRMMMMGGGPGGGLGMLALREDVQKELGLTAEQRNKIRDSADAMREEMMERMRAARESGGMPDREQMMKSAREMMEKSDKTLAEILKPEQMSRLKELALQRAGNGALMREDVQTELGLTADQKAKIQALQEKQQQAMQGVMERARNQEIEFSEVREIMEKNRKIMDEELGKVLTQAQRDKLKAMCGKPFTFDPNEEGQGMGFGGGRGGRRGE